MHATISKEGRDPKKFKGDFRTWVSKMQANYECPWLQPSEENDGWYCSWCRKHNIKTTGNNNRPNPAFTT
eukprot:799179-Prorocentrum_minimum.AAC.1